MAKILVIGYGNPLRGDDGVGWHAAQRLAQTIQGGDVQTLACHQLTLEQAEQVSRADFVIFIDARRDGAPGRLFCQIVEPNLSPSCAFSHHLTPPALLTCAQGLYGTCPEAALISVGGEFFGYGERLSPSVLSALPALLNRVYDLVARKAFRASNKTHRRGAEDAEGEAAEERRSRGAEGRSPLLPCPPAPLLFSVFSALSASLR